MKTSRYVIRALHDLQRCLWRAVIMTSFLRMSREYRTGRRSGCLARRGRRTVGRRRILMQLRAEALAAVLGLLSAGLVLRPVVLDGAAG